MDINLKKILFQTSLTVLLTVFLISTSTFTSSAVTQREVSKNPGGSPEKIDPGLLISVKSIHKEMKSGKRDMVLVDVRNPRAFETFRIPGSLNIPLFALKTKTFLKTNRLILESPKRLV